jgi:bifunctional non-homologous end joining protein LigD
MAIRGYLFDLDGTLVDSERETAEAMARALLRGQGIAIAQYKTLAFAISAALTGAAGALYALWTYRQVAALVLRDRAVLLGVDGKSDFDGLHGRKFNGEVQFQAFDLLMSDGDDLRKLPLSMRKANLARLLARRINGIFLSDFERGEIGPDLFRHACLMGLEGLVSKHSDRTYRAGVSLVIAGQ